MSNPIFKTIAADREVYIVDTTLRDGEQTAGVVFSNEEKIHIATLLDDIGVDQIEAGIPVMGGAEAATIKKITRLGLKASIMGWNRAAISDIEASIHSGVDAVAISISASDIHIKRKLQSSREKVLEKLVTAVEFAKKEGLYISANAEDASRSDPEFLVQFAQAAKQAGADRLRYCDTIGALDPLKTCSNICALREKVALDIEMHTHNDFGLATANALAGLQGGARFMGVTVNGLGERAGNAALEEVIMALKYVFHRKQDPYATEKLKEACEYVAKASGRILPIWKSIVGANMFAQKSGIHAAGILNLGVFDPEPLGLERQIVIGKHSGAAAITAKFREFGIDLDAKASQAILFKVRTLSVVLKRPLFDKELVYLFDEYVRNTDAAKAG